MVVVDRALQMRAIHRVKRIRRRDAAELRSVSGDLQQHKRRRHRLQLSAALGAQRGQDAIHLAADLRPAENSEAKLPLVAGQQIDPSGFVGDRDQSVL